MRSPGRSSSISSASCEIAGSKNQSYRASGLNLLVAAIILWNTRYLERALADMGTLDEVARHIAPLD